MRLFGLIGYPLGHSLSKQYFTRKFEEKQLTDHRYELFPIESIAHFQEEVLDAHPDLCGLNITIPYKKDVLPFLDDTSNLPLEACNCIHIKDGKLIGYNTDIIGFEQSLLEKLEAKHTPALVLGTGGAAEAVYYVLKKLGIPFKTVSRQAVTGDLVYEALTPEILADYKLIINCTPLGTYPNIEGCPAIPYEGIGSGHYLFDLVYNPVETRFLTEGKQRGASIKNGADMFTLQAEASWEIWNKS